MYTKDGEVNKGFLCRNVDEIYQLDPIMKNLIQKVTHMDQSVELLTTFCTVLQKSFYANWLDSIRAQCLKYDTQVDEIAQVLRVEEIPEAQSLTTLDNNKQKILLKNHEVVDASQNLLSPEITLPCKQIIESTITKILDMRFSGASKIEYKLEKQLKLLRSVYMKTSHVMNKFCKWFYTEVRIQLCDYQSQIKMKLLFSE